jgi:glycerol-3-phosphate acyltransferase PlsX
MTELIRISVDGMGGDFAPGSVVSGAVQAVSEFEVAVTLVGIEDQLKSELSRHSFPFGRISILHASEVVRMEDSAVSAVRKKKKSSLRMAIDLASRGEAEAVVSAGNTGAIYALVKVMIGTLPGIDRLPLAAHFPHPRGVSIVLDVGANVDCKPQHLVEFALMGSVYAEEILGIPNPKIGLLSIGAEEAKGNELTREVFALLKAGDGNFIGNVEGHDLFKGTADVIVCDGFVGNVALKTSESLVETILHVLRSEVEEQPRIAQILTRYFDYSELGGAPLLGARVASFVCHGKSTPKAIKNAIRIAAEFCRNGVNGRIHRKLSLLKNIV